MPSGTLVGVSGRWLLAFAAGLALAVALSLSLAQDADAASLTPGEQFLANNRLWFEYDYDRDLVCHLYDIRRGYPNSPVHLRVIDYAYPVNPFTNQCTFRTPLTPSYGGVGRMRNINGGRALVIRFPSGAVQVIRIGSYLPEYDALRVSRNRTGPSFWLGCKSPNNPFC